MEETITTLILHVLQLAVIACWGLALYSRNREMGIINCIFPIAISLSKRVSLENRFISLFVLYIYVLLLQDALMSLTGDSPIVYVISFAFVIIYELFLLCYICIGLVRKRFLIIAAFILLSLYIAYGAFYSIRFKSFDSINIDDFGLLVVKFSLCLLVITIIPMRKRISELKGVFFIVTGFALFFSLQMLSTGFQLVDYLGEWQFVRLVGIIAFTYWFMGSLWQKKFSS